MTTGNDDKRRAADGDDLPPSGAEARSQRKATSMPLIWLLVGMIVMSIFVFMIAQGGGLFHAQASGPAPIRAATSAGA